MFLKAFQDLMSGHVPRLAEEDTDVTPYVVDGVTYLSRLNSPYWTSSNGSTTTGKYKYTLSNVPTLYLYNRL